MKYRTIVQINRSDPDLPNVCMIAEEETASASIVEKKFGRGLTRLFRRNTQKYHVSKMERRWSVSETNLVRCSSLTESDAAKRLQVKGEIDGSGRGFSCK